MFVLLTGTAFHLHYVSKMTPSHRNQVSESTMSVLGKIGDKSRRSSVRDLVRTRETLFGGGAGYDEM